jgi:hypothetical protein
LPAPSSAGRPIPRRDGLHPLRPSVAPGLHVLIYAHIADELFGHARIAESQQRLPVQFLGVAVMDFRVPVT